MATEEEFIELAKQLRQPNGVKGIEIAAMMNETNISMTLHAIDNLNIDNSDMVLEIGHGNCGHLPYLLKQKSDLTYFGLETSELMNSEAKRIHQEYNEKQQAFFKLYDGINMPFSNNYFDKIFTVNTIYFWEQPTFFIAELYRVLKPNGWLNITYAQEEFMQQLPFTQFGFTLYNNEKIKQLINTTLFKVVKSKSETETIKSKIGTLADRTFTTITLQKP